MPSPSIMYKGASLCLLKQCSAIAPLPPLELFSPSILMMLAAPKEVS